jgi:hypothetical protein
MSPASPTIGYMTRMEYYHDVAALQAPELLPAAYAIVRNGLGRILLVRRADDIVLGATRRPCRNRVPEPPGDVASAVTSSEPVRRDAWCWFE